MQRGDEHGALDRKLECALFQQIIEHRANPKPIPIRPNSKGPPIRLAATDNVRRVLVQRTDEQHLVGELRARSQQRSERAGGDQLDEAKWSRKARRAGARQLAPNALA